jgi:hypothetical protein
MLGKYESVSRPAAVMHLSASSAEQNYSKLQRLLMCAIGQLTALT